MLLIDDDQRILDLIENIASGYNSLKATNLASMKNAMQQNEIGLVLCDYRLEHDNGIEILRWIRENYQNTRRILITGYLEVDVAVNAVNQADVHGVIKKPFDISELMNIIDEQFAIYNNNKFKNYEYQVMRSKLDSLPEQISRQTDELLELLLQITETNQIPNFSNHFVKALEGLKSLTSLNAQIYFENKSTTSFNHLLQYLSDIEVIANQYDQKILHVYILALRSYFYLYDDDFARSQEYHSAAKALLHWLQNQNLDPLLLESINDYPSHVDKETLTKPEMKPMIEIQINKLLSIDTGDLVGISESLFQHYRLNRPAISYFIIVRDEFPIYERVSADTKIEANLISGFVVALSKFLEEVAQGTGDIETINHENGVILFHSQEEFDFVLFSSVDDVSHRIGLRQIAFETTPILKEIPQGYTVSEDEREKINRIVTSLLGEF